jgi:DNA-binding beta-propeller fold protein YncE
MRLHLAAPLVFTVCLLTGAVDAGAATGDLAQKLGAAGCISDSGADPCADGRGLVTANSVAVSPDGLNAYVASFGGNAVAIIDRATDGTLTQKATTAGCISNSGSSGQCSVGYGLSGATSVAVSPDGHSVYATSHFDQAVVTFARADDGSLMQAGGTAGCISDGGGGGCLTGTALQGARSVAVSPGGGSVYVASPGSDAVAIFDRATDGTLTQKADTAGCISQTGTGGACAVGTGLDGATSVTVSPNRDSVYVASQDGDSVAVFDRASDGTLTQKLAPAGCVSETGASPCADGTALENAESVAVSPNGTSVYVASAQSDAVAVFDRASNGTLTQKPGTAGCISDNGSGGNCVDGSQLNEPASIAVSSDGQSAYVAALSSNAVVVFDRAADGTLTQKSGTAGCISEDGDPCAPGTATSHAASVALSPDGKSVYSASQLSAVAVFDRTLGATSTDPTPDPDPQPPFPTLPPDITKPLLGVPSLSPTSFRAAGTGPSTAARVGTTISYTLSEPATVRFRIERARPGRRAGSRCVKPRRSNRHAKRCTRYVTLRGSFTHAGKAGQNAFIFRGRLRGRKLAPGRYRLRAAATDAAGNVSPTKRSAFRITRR